MWLGFRLGLELVQGLGLGYMYVYECMYKLYLMTVKTWLQRNLPQGRLVSKS